MSLAKTGRMLRSGLFLFCFTAQMLWAQKTVVYAGSLLDVVSGEIKQAVTIRIEKDRFVSVEEGYVAVEEGDTVIDLKGYTVLPGLMDMHTHHSFQLSKKAYSERFRLDPADYAFRAAVYAERTLMAGFTTVRELGDSYNLSISLRNAIRDGWVKGPRIFSAGKSIATTGGHADPTNGVNSLLRQDPGPKQGVINGVDDARKAVRQRYKDGADLIKITATGGVLSVAKNGRNPQFTEQEIRAIVETAKDYEMTVAAHAHGAEGMKRAIRAGITSIEHGTYMDDEVIELMKRHGTFYVPTLMAGKWVAEKAAIPGFFPDVVRPKAATIGPVIQSTFTKAYRSGVKIAFGTDSGVSPHGDNAEEFELMVKGGMPALAAIRSATLTAALLLGVEAELGAVEPGKLADLIAVKGNPLEDISLLSRIRFVMKDGRVYKKP